MRRIVHHQVLLKVEYALTDWGQALCPALDALLTWLRRAILRSKRSRGTIPRTGARLRRSAYRG